VASRSLAGNSTGGPINTHYHRAECAEIEEGGLDDMKLEGVNCKCKYSHATNFGFALVVFAGSGVLLK
jgi:hypothetical protein